MEENGKDGKDGVSVGGSTGTISALKTAFDFDVFGTRNSNNKLFYINENFIPESTMVYINGIRLTRHINYDYIEVMPNSIRFKDPPDFGDIILIDYQLSNI